MYEEYYADDSRMEKNEKYIAPLYNYMIEKGLSVTISLVDEKRFMCLGLRRNCRNFWMRQKEIEIREKIVYSISVDYTADIQERDG